MLFRSALRRENLPETFQGEPLLEFFYAYETEAPPTGSIPASKAAPAKSPDDASDDVHINNDDNMNVWQFFGDDPKNMYVNIIRASRT